MMQEYQFYSDTNLQGFVYAAERYADRVQVYPEKRMVVVVDGTEQIRDIADQWGGVLL